MKISAQLGRPNVKETLKDMTPCSEDYKAKLNVKLDKWPMGFTLLTTSAPWQGSLKYDVNGRCPSLKSTTGRLRSKLKPFSKSLKTEQRWEWHKHPTEEQEIPTLSFDHRDPLGAWYQTWTRGNSSNQSISHSILHSKQEEADFYLPMTWKTSMISLLNSWELLSNYQSTTNTSMT